MVNGAFGLLNYCEIKDNHLSKNQILQRLDWFINHGNNRTYDMIDYEWLIYIEIKYMDDEEYQDVLQKIDYIKRMVAKNYLLKEKMKARLLLQK